MSFGGQILQKLHSNQHISTWKYVVIYNKDLRYSL